MNVGIQMAEAVHHMTIAGGGGGGGAGSGIAEDGGSNNEDYPGGKAGGPDYGGLGSSGLGIFGLIHIEIVDGQIVTDVDGQPGQALSAGTRRNGGDSPVVDVWGVTTKAAPGGNTTKDTSDGSLIIYQYECREDIT